MKIITKANFTSFTLFATVLLAGCFFAGAANAQTVQGTFTLDHAARWGNTVLPAGDYRLNFDPGADPSLAVISDARSGQRVATVLSAITEDGSKGHTALLIGRRGNQRVIYSFRVAELGESFVYDPALAHGRGVIEANNTETVRVLEARK
jgi:Na+-translocating ferredoxin:NAD+ oxidoreductase RnfG subunit